MTAASSLVTSATSTHKWDGPTGSAPEWPARSNWCCSRRLQTLDQHLAAGEGGRYDFAFIDADKSSYDAYYERCLVLLRPGGLIAIDNVLWSGRVAEPADAADADTAALQALNAKLLRDDRVDLALLPIGDGLTLARKR